MRRSKKCSVAILYQHDCLLTAGPVQGSRIAGYADATTTVSVMNRMNTAVGGKVRVRGPGVNAHSLEMCQVAAASAYCISCLARARLTGAVDEPVPGTCFSNALLCCARPVRNHAAHACALPAHADFRGGRSTGGTACEIRMCPGRQACGSATRTGTRAIGGVASGERIDGRFRRPRSTGCRDQVTRTRERSVSLGSEDARRRPGQPTARRRGMVTRRSMPMRSRARRRARIPSSALAHARVSDRRGCGGAYTLGPACG
jgi:hypothetical protein